jgi:hypothetical protein
MKKYIAIALLIVLGTAYPAYARWTVGAAGGAAAGGACTPSASGTVLFGNQSTAETNEVGDLMIDDRLFFTNTGYTATWAGDCSTETAASIKVYVRSRLPGNCKGQIINTSDGSVLATTNGLEISDTFEMSTITLSFASAPTITKGNSYKIGVICDTSYVINNWATDTTTGGMCWETGGSYDTPNSTVTCDIDLSENANIQWWVVK